MARRQATGPLECAVARLPGTEGPVKCSLGVGTRRKTPLNPNPTRRRAERASATWPQPEGLLPVASDKDGIISGTPIMLMLALRLAPGKASPKGETTLPGIATTDLEQGQSACFPSTCGLVETASLVNQRASVAQPPRGPAQACPAQRHPPDRGTPLDGYLAHVTTQARGPLGAELLEASLLPDAAVSTDGDLRRRRQRSRAGRSAGLGGGSVTCHRAGGQVPAMARRCRRAGERSRGSLSGGRRPEGPHQQGQGTAIDWQHPDAQSRQSPRDVVHPEAFHLLLRDQNQ